MRRDPVYTALALAVLALSIVPVGGAVFVLGFAFGDSPCVMCWEQRIGMLLISLIGLFVLRYGPRPRYVALAFVVAAWGIFMSLRHSSIHAARDVGQGFSVEILGAHTYTWAVFIYWMSGIAMAILLLVLGERDVPANVRAQGSLERSAMGTFLIVVAANVVQAFASTGPPPFIGQSDPVRFSFNPRHWVWSTEEWSFSPASLRGRWGIEKPNVGSENPDPAAGPLADLSPLALEQRKQLRLTLHGTPTDLAYEAATDRFLITTQHGVYITDGTLDHVVRYTVVDPGYSVDLGRFGGAAFLDSQTVTALGENKSYVILRENTRADPHRNFPFFLEAFDQFDHVGRGRFSTVRARMMYTMSLAYDATTQSLYTVTVPNAKVRRLVVSRFDRRDLTLSEEFLPILHPASGLGFNGPNRSLEDLFVTAATMDEGLLYTLSAAYGTLMAIDPRSRAVVAAYAVPGVEKPTGLAIKGRTIYILGENGSLTLAAKPGVTPNS